jgi:hypothetical protein
MQIRFKAAPAPVARLSPGLRFLHVLLWLPVFLLAACSTAPAPGERQAQARQKAAAAGLVPLSLAASPLPLRGFARLGCPGGDLSLYIEGDGYAWISVDMPSPDPTPVNPVALSLAALDPACNVVYLGRPGQYGAGRVNPRYWQAARFAPEVVASYVAVVRDLARRQQAPRVHLAGYSGGGALAALVAARLQREGGPPVTLRTVAANLDTDAWIAALRLSPLTGSQNPGREAAVLETVPQQHLTGSQDRQVSAAVLDAFLARLSTRACVQVVTVAAGHAGPWEDAWREALLRMPDCRQSASAPAAADTAALTPPPAQ